MEDMILTVNHLCKSYPQFSLSDVSFSLPKGAIMGLIGENGAGKSTTMKLILGNDLAGQWKYFRLWACRMQRKRQGGHRRCFR